MWPVIAKGPLYSIKSLTSKEGGIGFSVSRFWPFFRSVFRFLHLKASVFRFWYMWRFAVFPFLSIWFSVFGQNTSGFSDLISVVVSGFSYLVSGFCSSIMFLNRVQQNQPVASLSTAGSASTSSQIVSTSYVSHVEHSVIPREAIVFGFSIPQLYFQMNTAVSRKVVQLKSIKAHAIIPKGTMGCSCSLLHRQVHEFSAPWKAVLWILVCVCWTTFSKQLYICYRSNLFSGQIYFNLGHFF